MRRDPYLRNPVPLASRADEPVGSQDCSPIRSAVWRDRGPVNPRPLHGFYPKSGIAHAFASTEAGVAFEVGDGLAGFPASLIGRRGADVEMKVEHGSLRIRSARTAAGYLGRRDESLADEDGFVDTGDIVELQGDRYYFVGRGDGIINVGGRKVHPEEVEAVINRHPSVQMSLVKARKNPITDAVVVADIVVTRGDLVRWDRLRRAAQSRDPRGLSPRFGAAQGSGCNPFRAVARRHGLRQIGSTWCLTSS